MVEKPQGPGESIQPLPISSSPGVQKAPQEEPNKPAQKFVQALTTGVQAGIDSITSLLPSPALKEKFQEAVKEGRISEELADKKIKKLKDGAKDFLAAINFGVRGSDEGRGTDFNAKA